MASSWTVSGDLVTVKIRPGIQWHGGGELTADDVLYTLTDAAGLQSNARFSGLLAGLAGTAPTPYEVEFNLTGFASRGRFFQEILTLPILPDGFTAASAPNGTGPFTAGSTATGTVSLEGEYLVAKATQGQEFAQLHSAYLHDGVYDTYNGDLALLNNNTTTVPFTLLSMPEGTVQFTPPLQQDMSIRATYSIDVLSRRMPAFEGFFKPNLPYLDALVLTFFPDDGGTPLDETMDGGAKALLDGRVDFLSWTVPSVEATALRWEGTPEQATISGATDLSPSFTTLYLGMNNQVPPLDDPVLRQAIARVLDKDLYLTIEPNTVPGDSMVVPANSFWYNDSVPRYRVPKGEVGGRPESILDGVNLMLDQAGYLDRDNDGWRDRPQAPYASFSFTLLSITDLVDPRKAIIGSNIRDNLQKVGINTGLEAYTPAEIQQRIDGDTFDLYLRQTTSKADPSFLRDALHSGGSRNYVNAADPALDALLDAMEGAVDQDVRRQYAMDAQGWIGVNAPLAPILHFDLLNAREKAVYQGWVSTVGGRHNYWTYVGLNQIPSGSLVVDVSTFTTSFVGGDTADVTVRVTDQDGFPVSGVALTLSTSPGGSLDIGTATTDATGANVEDITFTAQPTGDVRDVTITVTAEKAAYASAVGFWRVTVHPSAAQLVVAVSRSPLSIGSEDEATIFVNVTDGSTGLPVANATVTLTATPSGIGESLGAAAGTTNALGAFQTTFAASVSIESTFTITATVSAAGYEDAEGKTFLRVTRRTAAPETPGLDTVAMVTVVVLLALAYTRWQRRRRD